MSKPYWTPSEFPFNTCFLLVHRPKILVSGCYLVSWLSQCPWSWPWQMQSWPAPTYSKWCYKWFSVLPLCVVLFASPCWQRTWAIPLGFWTPTWAFLSWWHFFDAEVSTPASIIIIILLHFSKTSPCSLHTFLMLGRCFLRASPALHIMSSDLSADKICDYRWDTDRLGLLIACYDMWYCLVVPLFFPSVLIRLLSLILNS